MPMSSRSVFSSPEKFVYAQRKKIVFCRKVEEFWRTAVAGSRGDSPVFIKDIQDGVLITFEIFELI